MTQTVRPPSKRPELDPDRLAALEEQRDFLLASLTDLEREHDAGDLDDADYRELRDDYTARAAQVIRDIGASRTAFADAGTRRPGRALLWAGGVALFAVLAGVAVAASLGARKPGETSSGGINVAQTTSQRAQQCIPKITQEPPATSIACFKKVLDEDPENAVALTWLAWDLALAAGEAPSVTGGALPANGQTDDSLAALRTSAARLLDRAVAADSGYSFARAFRAVVAYRNGDAAAARKYLADFRANDPSTEAESVIAQEQLEAKIAALDPSGG